MVDFLTVGMLDERTYAVTDDAGRGFLIDPGAEPDRIRAWIRRNGWTIEAILLTHGHFDHIGAVSALREALGIPVWASSQAAAYLDDPRMNLSIHYTEPVRISADRGLEDGDTAETGSGSLRFRVLSVPGHTRDSIAFYDEKGRMAFVGDTIFAGAVGRTDLPGGSREELTESILNRIFRLPGDTVLYSGHSEPTDVQTEKKRYGIQ